MSDKKSKAESALDAIFEILDELRDLKKQVVIIDSNVKLANNKIASLKKIVVETTPVPEVSNPGISASPADKIEKSGELGGLVIGKIKTYGVIVNRNKKPISDVDVKLYNENGDIIKERRTDRDGYWEARLPPGKYGVEYIHGGFKPINLVIELDENMKEFEVR
jgi:hypothetical protein